MRQDFERLFYPGLCRVMGGFKDLGLMVIKHTDGNLWKIIDMLVDSGIDCLDPIDPLGGMDLAEVKAKYGDRIALKGNVDCVHLMSFGTPNEVIEATKEALKRYPELKIIVLTTFHDEDYVEQMMMAGVEENI